MRKSILVLALGLASASAFAAPVAYTMDPHHTQTIFSWNHLGFSNPTANFDKIEGTIHYDADDVSNSSVEVTIATNSINAHVEKFNHHLKSADFFDVAKFPTATFKSTKVEKGTGDAFKVSGDLTIHGVTKPVTIDAKLNHAGEHPMSKTPAVGFDGSVMIKRSDFGLGMNTPYVSDEVKIQITTEASVPKKGAK